MASRNSAAETKIPRRCAHFSVPRKNEGPVHNSNILNSHLHLLNKKSVSNDLIASSCKTCLFTFIASTILLFHELFYSLLRVILILSKITGNILCRSLVPSGSWISPETGLWPTSFNPLRPVAISKQREWIGRSAYILSWSIATALHSDIHQTAGSGGHLNMWENRCVRATVCLLRAGRPTRAGDMAKSGQFIGQLSWVTGDSIGLKGLTSSQFGLVEKILWICCVWNCIMTGT